MILFISIAPRRPLAGRHDQGGNRRRCPALIALFGVLMIMIIMLAVLALVVVKALGDSPWGTFTVCATIPIAMFMGIYLRVHPARPGRSKCR